MRQAASKFVKACFFAILLLWILDKAALSQAHEYGLPVGGLGRYETFRKVVLRNGYKPVLQAYHVDQFIEILCGNTTCGASWLRPDGQKISFEIWFEYKGNEQVFYLAPSFD